MMKRLLLACLICLVPGLASAQTTFANQPNAPQAIGPTDFVLVSQLVGATRVTGKTTIGNLSSYFLSSGAITAALGFTPANKAGDTFTGPVNLASGSSYQINGTNVLGPSSLAAAMMPALTGDVTSSSGTVATTIAAGAVNAAKMASGAAVGNLGFAPASNAFTQAGTGAAARTVDAKLKDVASVLDFGARCDGSTDDTSAIQAAITAAQARGGWMLTFPAATCNVSGTLTMSGSRVHLYGAGRGATTLAFTGGGTADAFQVGAFPTEANCVGATQPGTCLQAADSSVRNMSITASARTGGWLFNVYGQSGLVLEDLAFNGWDLIQAQFFNTLIMNRVVGYTNDTTNQSVSLFQKITTGTTNGWFRSDVASFTDVVVNNNSHGGSCVNIDGMINTVRFARTALLNCAYGLSVSNSQASASFYPSFLMTDDLEIDGSSKTAININAGREFHFSGCDINAKSATSTSYFAVAVSPDLSGSVTSGVYFTGCSVHTAPGAVAFFNAKHVSIDGSNFYDSNKNVTTGTSPVIQINGGDGFTFTGGLIGQRYGDSKAPSFGVQIDNGVGPVSVVGVNLKGALTKSISNASASAISFVGGITYAGAANTVTTCATGTTC